MQAIARIKLASAQEFRGRNGALTGPLDLRQLHRAAGTGDKKRVVQDFAGRALAVRDAGIQDLEAFLACASS